MTHAPSHRDRVRGCLLGGAVGDALGAPVEFWGLEQITQTVGPGGVRDYLPARFATARGVGLVTDDTQMTLFTVEGLIRAHVRYTQRGICHPPSVVHHAYQRWLTTQEVPSPPRTRSMDNPTMVDGWLGRQKWLYSRRAPGNTCLSALHHTRGAGFGEPARNDSKGCGAVMRSAPFGLMRLQDPAGLAVESAALTHGHPTGQIASGALALLIDTLMGGRPLTAAVEIARAWAGEQPDGTETADALDAATRASQEDRHSPRVVSGLGEGWIAEEALAIAVYCALACPEHDQFLDAVSLAVTHGGDSDSTGAICGNILGALHGQSTIPELLLTPLEGRSAITLLADDLSTVVEDPDALIEGFAGLDAVLNDTWLKRYPGW